MTEKSGAASNRVSQKKNMIMKNGIFRRMLFFSIVFVYYELVFHAAIYKHVDSNIIHPVTFAVAFGVTLGFVCSLFGSRVNKIIAYTVCVVVMMYGFAQYIYYTIFQQFMTVASVSGAADAMSFKSVLFEALREKWYMIIAFLTPIAVLVIFTHIGIINFERCKKWLIKIDGGSAEKYSLHNLRPGRLLIDAMCVIVSWEIALNCLGIHRDGTYSPYKLFHENFIAEASMDKLGYLATGISDIKASMLGKRYEMDYQLVDTSETDTNPNLQVDTRIDLTQLYNSTSDYELKNITAYLSAVQPTEKNEYTGMFEGYNLVFITAESFSKYALSEEATPTLYKIFNEGFVFNNFYTPLWYRNTADGEYVNCFGQYPILTDWTIKATADKYEPYGLGNMLNELGYKSYAYHDNDADFYDRDKTFPNLGYDFTGIGRGLELTSYDGGMYSDLECMEEIYKDFIDEPKFNMYFMSYSGHMPYNYDKQGICSKNRETAEKALAGRGYSDEATAYVASQMELDQAVEFLIQKLDEADKLDNTLFVIAADHYPKHCMSDGVYNELAGMDVENTPFEVYRNGLCIWSSSMSQPIEVDKVCSNVDILPTILNLMGVEYDSRVFAGRDIFSDEDGMVVFSDHSFLTDKVTYNTATETAQYLVPESQVPDGYVETIQKQVEDRIYICERIVYDDYFSFLFKEK